MILYTAHHLILLPCQPVHIIRFIGRYAVRALKDFHTQNPQNDTAVGQLIILLQLDLLKEETYIRRLFQAKIKEGSFIYPPLLKYITRILWDLSTLSVALGLALWVTTMNIILL